MKLSRLTPKGFPYKVVSLGKNPTAKRTLSSICANSPAASKATFTGFKSFEITVILRPANCAVLFLFLFLASCKQHLKTEKEETGFWHNQLVDSSYRLLYKDEDTARALRYYDALWDETGRSGVYPAAARFGLIANYHYFFTHDNRATAAMIDSALAFYQSEERQRQYPRSYVGMLLFGGHIAYRLTQYTKANDYYFRAKEVADAHLSPCERTAFHYNIAMVLYKQENFRQSLGYFKEAYRLQATCAPQTTAVVLQQQEIQSNIGLCYIQLKNYDSAHFHFDRALAIANQYKDSLGPATMDKINGVLYGNRAQIAIAKGNYSEAEDLSLKSIALNDRKNFEVENALGIKLQLAQLYFNQHDMEKMKDLLATADPSILRTNAKLRMDWSRLKSSIHEWAVQKDSALYFLKQYFVLRDSLTNEQKQLTAADVARQLRDKEQQLRIAVLTEERQQATILLVAVIVFSGLVIAILYLLYKNFRRSKKSLALALALNEEIKRQRAAREQQAKEHHKQITEAVIKAQEKERSVIGLELHDNINQVLTTVKLQNEMVLEGIAEPKAILPRSTAYLQSCINEIRSLSKRLSAPTLGKISLEESVKDLVDSINETSKVKITRQISGLDNELLKQDLHIGVYRILQEQLNNVLKHADATEVLVKLERLEGKLHLLVADNGKGFVVQGQKQGIGLVNMQTRAENLNGTFELTTRPGKGCRVKVVLPCLQ